MATLVKAGSSLVRNALRLTTSLRSISTTAQLNIKEIREKTDGKSLVIEAVNVPSPRTELLIKAEKLPVDIVPKSDTPSCYMCSLGLDVKHTDVLILSQFLRSDGCMLPRRVTGLCRRQQKKIGKMVSMAQKAGLMINITPDTCKKDPTLRWNWKKFNTYYDEKTIFLRRIPKPNDRYKR